MVTPDESIKKQLGRNELPILQLSNTESMVSISGDTLLKIKNQDTGLTLNKGIVSLVLSAENIESMKLKESDRISILIEPATLSLRMENDDINNALLKN